MRSPPDRALVQRIVGRYAIFDEIASGGMATVHIGRLLGPVGFSRTVAIKRLHPQFAKDPEFGTMFLDEARLAARVRHPNVVPTLDVVAMGGELYLVMEYIQGESLARLLRTARSRGERIPRPIVTNVIVSLLHGLHAAHEAKSERGEPLGIVHRDVSPQNVLVGVDGVARVLDFGVAKAAGRVQTTREGQLKGKIAYMAPEQVRGSEVDRRSDVYAASVVLWECLTSERLFEGEHEGSVLAQVIEGKVAPPSERVPGLPRALDEVVLRGLSTDPNARFATAREMAHALERVTRPASSFDVGEWVEAFAGDVLQLRAERVAEIESASAELAYDDQGEGAAVGPSSYDEPAEADPRRARPGVALSGAHRASAEFGGSDAARLSQPPSPFRDTGASQLSSISVSRPKFFPPPTPTSREGLARLALVAVFATTALAGVVIVLRAALQSTTSHSVAEAAPPVVRRVAPPAPSSSADAPATPDAPASDTAAATPIESMPLLSPTAPSHAGATAAHAPMPRVPKPAPSAARVIPVDCNPPTFVGTDGIKHVKPQCMR